MTLPLINRLVCESLCSAESKERKWKFHFSVPLPSNPEVLIRSGERTIARTRCLTSCAVSSGESAEKELLGQAYANPFGGADRKISEDQPGTTIGSGIVKVPEGGDGQVATEA